MKAWSTEDYPSEITKEIESMGRRQRHRQDRHPCPFPDCSPSRVNKRDPCLSILDEGDRLVWNCWHCQRSGLFVEEREKREVRTKMVQPIEPIEDDSPLTDEQYKWLAERGISRNTADKCKLFSQIKYIGKIGEHRNTISFPYFNKDQIYAAKHRALPKHFVCSGSPQTLWRAEEIDSSETLYILEGEMDALSMVECGMDNAMSIPNGAVNRIVSNRASADDDPKFKFIWSAREAIEKCEKIVVALDKDEAGEVTAEEIARRIGKAKCWTVSYPEDCKDANDVLAKYGPDRLKKCMKDLTPWPVSGLHEVKDFKDEVFGLYSDGLGRGETTGYSHLDEIFTVMPGHLTIVTGIPSSGKTEFIDQLLMNLAEISSWKSAICSFENIPSIHIANLAAKRERMPFFGPEGRRMGVEALSRSFGWVSEHFVFVHDRDGEGMSVSDITEKLKAAVMRYGIRAAVVDPYNMINRPGDVSETEWVSTILTQLRNFAQAFEVHLFFVAHPFKLQRQSDGTTPPPGGYDISGSAHFYNKTDNGLTVHRPNPMTNEVLIRCWKARYAWISKMGDCTLLYNLQTHRYDQPDSWGNSPAGGEF